MSELSQAPVCEKHGCEKVWYSNPKTGKGQWICRECKREYARAYWAANHEECKAKMRERGRERYYADLEASRERARANTRAYRAKNREKVLEGTRRWRRENPQHLLDYSAKYREENREKILEKQKNRLKTDPAYAEKRRKQIRNWQEANRDKAREAAKRWKDENPESTKMLGSLRRARERDAVVPDRPVTAAVQARRMNLFGGCCFCGSSKGMTLEHIVPLSAGGLHVEENLLGSCKSCNSSKHVKPVEAWYRAQPFFSEERWLEILQVTSGKEPDEDAVGASAA